MDEEVRVWLVEETFDADGTRVVSAVYATPDGSRYLRHDATGAGADPGRVPASLDVTAARLSVVDDPGTRETYAAAVRETRKRHRSEEVA